jgi:hypothetical protein
MLTEVQEDLECSQGSRKGKKCSKFDHLKSLENGINVKSSSSSFQWCKRRVKQSSYAKVMAGQSSSQPGKNVNPEETCGRL